MDPELQPVFISRLLEKILIEGAPKSSVVLEMVCPAMSLTILQASNLIKEHTGTTPTFSYNWLTRFLNQFPILKTAVCTFETLHLPL